MNTEYRDKLDAIKTRMLAGDITYDEAKRLAAPVLKAMNDKAKEVSKRYGMRHKPIGFASVMR